MNRRLRRFLRRLPLVWLWVDALEDRALERRMKEQGHHAILMRIDNEKHRTQNN